MKSQEIRIRLFRGATLLEIVPPFPRGCPRRIWTQKFQMDRFRNTGDGDRLYRHSVYSCLSNCM